MTVALIRKLTMHFCRKALPVNLSIVLKIHEGNGTRSHRQDRAYVLCSESITPGNRTNDRLYTVKLCAAISDLCAGSSKNPLRLKEKS